MRFQFTPLREGRPRKSHRCAKSQKFQFTPLREGRQCSLVGRAKRWYFNSRPSARGDKCLITGCAHLAISIHAPPRGATVVLARMKPSWYNFNSRPSARGDMAERAGQHAGSDFNSRPSARGDQCDGRFFWRRLISIHAPPRGATCCPRHHPLHHVSISIHAPPRGATAKDMQFLQIFCSTLTNQHGLTIMPRNLSRLFW